MRVCVQESKRGRNLSHCIPYRSFAVRKGRTETKVNPTADGGLCGPSKSSGASHGGSHSLSGSPGHGGRRAAPRGSRRRERRRGQTESCFTRRAASSMPTDSTVGGRKRGSPPFALAARTCSSRYIHFCGARKPLSFAWE